MNRRSFIRRAIAALAAVPVASKVAEGRKRSGMKFVANVAPGSRLAVGADGHPVVLPPTGPTSIVDFKWSEAGPISQRFA